MRKAGILLHPTSLPGPGPCGDLGEGAIRFLDWLAAAGCSLWQVLPLNPPGGGFSPYNSPGAHAGGTHLLSVDRLVEDGLLRPEEVYPRPRTLGRVDVGALDGWHAPLVARAGARLSEGEPALIASFREQHRWVEDFALFRALSRAHGGGWERFPTALRRHEPDAVAAAMGEQKAEVEAEIGLQVLFQRQWNAVREAARMRHIEIVGDIPIYVAGDGADVWANQGLFLWDQDGRADPVSGVPPDYFSPKGQLWGNPLYAWAEHAKDGYGWWIARLREAFACCDHVRLDHFRGFAAAWAVPLSAEGDASKGAWTPGPGMDLFNAAKTALGGLPIIAEDLGLITPDVEAMRDSLGVPGMKILQFGFGGEPDHPFLAHNWEHPRWVAYTGTHDNDTARGWYQSADEATRHRFRVYVGRDGSEPHWDLIRLGWSSIARWAIAPMQDVLGLGSEARMNTPAEAAGNWTWRAPILPEDAAWRLRELSHTYGRIDPGPRKPEQ